MLVSVGSGSNTDDPDTHPKEFHRPDVLEYTPDGKFVKIYASGIRNCVGEAIYPNHRSALVTPEGQVWGRPVGVTFSIDGSLFVTDDGSRSVWHVTYTGQPSTNQASR